MMKPICIAAAGLVGSLAGYKVLNWCSLHHEHDVQHPARAPHPDRSDRRAAYLRGLEWKTNLARSDRAPAHGDSLTEEQFEVLRALYPQYKDAIEQFGTVLVGGSVATLMASRFNTVDDIKKRTNNIDVYVNQDDGSETTSAFKTRVDPTLRAIHLSMTDVDFKFDDEGAYLKATSKPDTRDTFTRSICARVTASIEEDELKHISYNFVTKKLEPRKDEEGNPPPLTPLAPATLSSWHAMNADTPVCIELTKEGDTINAKWIFRSDVEAKLLSMNCLLLGLTCFQSYEIERYQEMGLCVLRKMQRVHTFSEPK